MPPTKGLRTHKSDTPGYTTLNEVQQELDRERRKEKARQQLLLAEAQAGGGSGAAVTGPGAPSGVAWAGPGGLGHTSPVARSVPRKGAAGAAGAGKPPGWFF